MTLQFERTLEFLYQILDLDQLYLTSWLESTPTQEMLIRRIVNDSLLQMITKRQ